MRLTQKDVEALELIKKHGFATFGQLQRIYDNKANTSYRSRKMAEVGFLKADLLKNLIKDTVISGKELNLLSCNVHSKIYCLTDEMQRRYPSSRKVSDKNICIHQLLVNELSYFLLKDMRGWVGSEVEVLNEEEHQFFASLNLVSPKTLSPDLTFNIKGTKIKMAVEIERRLKRTKTRYFEKFLNYETSNYTHVLYYYSDEDLFRKMIKFLGPVDNFGFSYIGNPSEVISPVFGKMEYKDWFLKVAKIKGLLNECQ